MYKLVYNDTRNNFDISIADFLVTQTYSLTTNGLMTNKSPEVVENRLSIVALIDHRMIAKQSPGQLVQETRTEQDTLTLKAEPHASFDLNIDCNHTSLVSMRDFVDRSGRCMLAMEFALGQAGAVAVNKSLKGPALPSRTGKKPTQRDRTMTISMGGQTISGDVLARSTGFSDRDTPYLMYDLHPRFGGFFDSALSMLNDAGAGLKGVTSIGYQSAHPGQIANSFEHGLLPPSVPMWLTSSFAAGWFSRPPLHNSRELGLFCRDLNLQKTSIYDLDKFIAQGGIILDNDQRQKTLNVFREYLFIENFALPSFDL